MRLDLFRALLGIMLEIYVLDTIVERIRSSKKANKTKQNYIAWLDTVSTRHHFKTEKKL